MTEKIPINGIKLSGRLVAVRVRRQSQPPTAASVLQQLCRLFAHHHINIVYLTTGGLTDEGADLCCIDAEDLAGAEALVGRQADLKTLVCFGEAVGLITFYPHRASLKLLASALRILSEGAISIYGLASSLSALTFVVDFADLDRAAGLLSQNFQLPGNPAPFRAEFRVRQAQRSS